MHPLYKAQLQIWQDLHRKNIHVKDEMKLPKRTFSCQIFFLLLTKDYPNISKPKFPLYFEVFGCLEPL